MPQQNTCIARPNQPYELIAIPTYNVFKAH
jgi:hypothetical protein